MILKSKPIKKTREKSENFCKQTDLLTHNKFLIPQQTTTTNNNNKNEVS